MKNDMKNMSPGTMNVKVLQNAKSVPMKSAEEIKKMAASAPLPPGDVNADMGHAKIGMSKEAFLKSAVINGIKRKANG